MDAWDDQEGCDLLKEYILIIAELSPGTITWASDVGLYSATEETAIDAAANLKDMAGLRKAVASFKEATSRLMDEKKRTMDVMKQAIDGTLKGSHRLPVRKAQQGLLGKVILIVETQMQAEVLSVHSLPDTTTFYREEFASFLRALQSGDDVAGWMMAKRGFGGVSVRDSVTYQED